MFHWSFILYFLFFLQIIAEARRILLSQESITDADNDHNHITKTTIEINGILMKNFKNEPIVSKIPDSPTTEAVRGNDIVPIL